MACLAIGGAASAAPASVNPVSQPAPQAEAETQVQRTTGYKNEGPFLTKDITLSNSAAYKPLNAQKEIGKGVKEKRSVPSGILYSKKGDTAAGALIFNGVLKAPNPMPKGEEDLLGDLFQHNKQGEDNIALFNEFVPAFSVMVNEEIRAGILQKNKKDHLAIPENIMHVDLKDFEKLSPWGRHGYSSGGRFLVEADGWLVPLYVKTYIFQSGSSYRYIVSVTSDASRDIMKPALDLLGHYAEDMK